MLRKSKSINHFGETFGEGGRPPSGPGFGDHLSVSNGVAFFIARDRLDSRQGLKIAEKVRIEKTRAEKTGPPAGFESGQQAEDGVKCPTWWHGTGEQQIKRIDELLADMASDHAGK